MRMLQQVFIETLDQRSMIDMLWLGCKDYTTVGPVPPGRRVLSRLKLTEYDCRRSPLIKYRVIGSERLARLAKPTVV